MRPKAGGKTDVRFGSKADTCGAKRYVRFTPESGHDLATPALSSWATGLTAHVWASNPFVDQNCTHVAPLCPQARTQTTVVALLRPFGPRRTTTRDTLQSRLTIGNELAEAGGCRVQRVSAHVRSVRESRIPEYQIRQADMFVRWRELYRRPRPLLMQHLSISVGWHQSIRSRLMQQTKQQMHR